MAERRADRQRVAQPVDAVVLSPKELGEMTRSLLGRRIINIKTIWIDAFGSSVSFGDAGGFRFVDVGREAEVPHRRRREARDAPLERVDVHLDDEVLMRIVQIPPR